MYTAILMRNKKGFFLSVQGKWNCMDFRKETAMLNEHCSWYIYLFDHDKW